MRRRTLRLAARGSFAITSALCLGTGVFLALAWDVPKMKSEFGFKGFAIAFALVLGGLGLLLADRRPPNPIGWIFCALGLIAGTMALTTEYARWALIHEGGRPPGALYVAWLQEWVWIPLIVGLGVVGWIFPEGRFLSRRWRAAMVVACALAAVPMVLNALLPRLTIFAGFDNPVGLDEPWVQGAANASAGLVLPVLFGGAAAATVRFRRRRGDERQQIKWLLLAVMAVGLALAYYGIILGIILATGTDPSQGAVWPEYLAIASFLAVPISVAFGVLKYRLYDIDVVINKAAVYAVLAVFITGVYLTVVVAAGSLTGYASNPALSGIAAAIVALAFQPVRRGTQRLANRLVYGERATPYEVLAQLGDRLAGEYAADDVLDRIAAALAGGIGADRVVVWLDSAGELRPAAIWPREARAAPIAASATAPTATEEGMRSFPVRHQGEMLGAIGVHKPPSDPLTPADEKLVGDLAAQAGLVLRNARLIEDLRASRRRLVTAQDEERRRLERNIHDGAQQQLVALTVKARLAEQMIDRDPAKARDLVAQIGTETTGTLEDLRDLARGIYPPLLADKGLAAALEAQGRKAAVPVAVKADGVGRLDRDVEAGVYFCVLEALNNVAKYAGASHVDVRLWWQDGEVVFEVGDDGVGFDPAARGYGTGLRGMADRLEALGGSLEVQSAPRAGTKVLGRVPAARAEHK
ncbi:MAG: GAF domain-containing sensor histidine kinase [Actinomycetota bacterium]|nr:GAF domain-containing sensor histidine kinase [Actinomycetota bacterium]